VERRYSSYSFSTSELDGSEWSASRPGRALAPGKGPPVPIVQEAGWAPEPVWTQRLEEKILSPLLGIEPRLPARPARFRFAMPNMYLSKIRTGKFISYNERLFVG
jgi:hypothetical protein